MSERITSRLAPSFLPTTAVLEMTYHCNHACLFCSCPWYAEDNGFDIREELNTAQWKEVIRKLCDMGVCNIAFTGGEPLLRGDIVEIIEYAASCTTEHIETKDGSLVSRAAPPALFLLSNGKAMRQDIVDLCARHTINLSISLPGLTEFENHTQGGDADNVLRWFQTAREHGVTTTVGITVTRKNLHELYETIGEALLAGADTLLMNRFLPGGRGIRYAEELQLNADEIVQMLDTAEEVLRIANRRGSVGTELPRCIMDEQKYTHLQVGTQCAAGRSFFVVDPSGYTRVCNHSPVRLNHVSEIEKLKDNPYWRQFVTKDYLPDACIACDRTDVCDGGCREAAHVVTGSPCGVDPVFSKDPYTGVPLVGRGGKS